MEKNKVSQTALFMAYLRGYHAAHDFPKIFDDFLAHQLLGREVCEFYEQQYTSQQGLQLAESLGFKGAASCQHKETALSMAIQAISPLPLPVSRARYAEDSLEQAVKQGVEQYVILGSGLDTFTYRHPETLGKLQVFEIDHPDMQAYKRHRLDGMGWKQPEQLHFVPVDFLHENLTSALSRSTYDQNALSFFSWLGVTYYLTRDAVFNTLKAIVDIGAAGSTVVFDYVHSDVFIPEKTSQLMKLGLKFLQDKGEPWITGFESSSLAPELSSISLRIQEDLSPDEIEERFFQGRTDSYHAYELVHFVSAIVE